MSDSDENKAGNNLKADKANHLEEWKQARGMLQFFDNKSYDLRKYGFTFFTALLTAEGILLPKDSEFAAAPIRFAVYSVTLLLILALHLIDNNFRVYKRAANTRALVLEKKLNLELSETITDRYKEECIDWKIMVLYFIFILGISFLGLFSLRDDWLYFSIFFALFIIASLRIVFSYLQDISYKYGHRENWTISPLECTRNDKIFITLTNFNETVEVKNLRIPSEENQDTSNENKYIVEYLKKNKRENGGKIKIRRPIHFDAKQVVFEIINEVSGDSCHEEKADRNIDIYDNHTWIIKGEICKESGVYQIRPRGWPLPLNRRITVSDESHQS